MEGMAHGAGDMGTQPLLVSIARRPQLGIRKHFHAAIVVEVAVVVVGPVLHKGER